MCAQHFQAIEGYDPTPAPIEEVVVHTGLPVTPLGSLPVAEVEGGLPTALSPAKSLAPGDLIQPPASPKLLTSPVMSPSQGLCIICATNNVPEEDWLTCSDGKPTHAVCAECLDNLVKNECPMCRSPLSGKLITPIVMEMIELRQNQEKADMDEWEALNAQLANEFERRGFPDSEIQNFYGRPIDELRQAMEELRNGTYVRAPIEPRMERLIDSPPPSPGIAGVGGMGVGDPVAALIGQIAAAMGGIDLHAPISPQEDNYPGQYSVVVGSPQNFPFQIDEEEQRRAYEEIQARTLGARVEEPNLQNILSSLTQEQLVTYEATYNNLEGSGLGELDRQQIALMEAQARRVSTPPVLPTAVDPRIAALPTISTINTVVSPVVSPRNPLEPQFTRDFPPATIPSPPSATLPRVRTPPGLGTLPSALGIYALIGRANQTQAQTQDPRVDNPLMPTLSFTQPQVLPSASTLPLPGGSVLPIASTLPQTGLPPLNSLSSYPGPLPSALPSIGGLPSALPSIGGLPSALPSIGGLPSALPSALPPIASLASTTGLPPIRPSFGLPSTIPSQAPLPLASVGGLPIATGIPTFPTLPTFSGGGGLPIAGGTGLLPSAVSIPTIGARPLPVRGRIGSTFESLPPPQMGSFPSIGALPIPNGSMSVSMGLPSQNILAIPNIRPGNQGGTIPAPLPSALRPMSPPRFPPQNPPPF